MPISNRALLLIGAATLGGIAIVPAVPVAAQGRPVVQPLPPAASNDLNRALLRLASNPRDIDALILAGDASLELDDIDAAIGFFGRAEELSPNNPRVKAGTAAAYVRERRPVEALRLFEEAERAGVRPASVDGDKGLAHDLVGNNLEAQQAYRRSLAYDDDSEIRRRMALSYAIAGDSEGFESTLLPLLNERDFAAYRTRAFGLAILGKPDEAVSIANAVMPKEMAERVEPYLRYMRRLTPAQQAAAGNLGIFPRASAIGRDDPRIAAVQTAGSSPAIAGVDSGLAPSGRPLGQSTEGGAQPSGETASGSSSLRGRSAILAQQRELSRLRRSGDRRVRVAQTPPVPTIPAPTPAAPPAAISSSTPVAVAKAPTGRTERGELPALVRADVPATVIGAQAPEPTRAPAPAPEPAPAPAPAASIAALPPAPAPTPAPAPMQIAQAVPAAAPTPVSAVRPVSQGPQASQTPKAPQAPQPMAEVAVAASSVAPVSIPADPSTPGAPDSSSSGPGSSGPVTVAVLDPSVAAASPSPGFNLADLASEPVGAAVGVSAVASPIQSNPAPVAESGVAPVPAPEPAQRVSQAFADLMALPDPATITPPANAVDITAIRIPREEAAPAPAVAPPKPPVPSHASRIWVQVATGKDQAALKFDWRRFARQAPDVLSDNGPFVVPWGETNRLLAGPYDSRNDANAAISALAGKGIGAFRFTSAAGQAIEQLGN